MKDDILSIADQHFRRGEYKQAVIHYKHLISENEDQKIKIKLAYSYLYLGHFDEAYNLLEQVQRIDYNNLSVLSAMAFIELKLKNIDSAVNLWCRINEDYPKHIKTSRALDDLKLAASSNEFAEQASPVNFVDKPIVKRKFRFKLPVKHIKIAGYIMIGILGLAIIIFGFHYYYKTRNNRILPIIKVLSEHTGTRNTKYSSDSGLSSNFWNSIDKDKYLIRKNKRDKDSQIYFKYKSVSEVNKDIKKIKNDIKNRKSNRAIMLINKIKYSNASESFKEKMKLLLDFVPKPELDRVEDNPDIKQIKKKPYLYENVFIKWDGSIKNLKFKNKEAVFDFIVKYLGNSDEKDAAAVFYSSQNEKDLLLGDYDSVIVFGRFKTMIDKKPYLEAYKVILLKKKLR